MRYIFLGDVHGNIKRCHDVCIKYPDAMVVQIGDLGVGFIFWEIITKLPSNFRFFPGNHDKRSEALTIPSCLGNYGNVDGKFFFVSGANSIDKDQRIEGVSWWHDEELTYKQLNHALDLWEKSKVQVLVSHDCPQRIAQYNHLIYDQTPTRQVLDQMIEVRKPKMICYGHHHRSAFFDYEGIKVKALGIDETFEITL